MEEKRTFEIEKKKLNNSISESKGALDEMERKYREYRWEQDESPMAVLRAEIQNKNLQVMELESQVQKEKEKAEQANEATGLMKKQLQKLRWKLDEKEEESRMKNIHELENLKKTLAEQQWMERDRLELETLRKSAL